MTVALGSFVLSYQEEDEEAEEEINGVLSAIANSCKADKITKVDPDKSAKTPLGRKVDKTQHRKRQMTKGLFSIFDCFRVKNPYHIDNYARISFPLLFIIINVFYWVYYLCF